MSGKDIGERVVFVRDSRLIQSWPGGAEANSMK